MSMLVERMIKAHCDYLRSRGDADNTVTLTRYVLRRLARQYPDDFPALLPEELEQWLAGDDDTTWSAQTQETYRKRICCFYKWAARPTDPWLDYNPAAGLQPIRVPPGMPRPATDEQARAACGAAMPNPWRLHCVLAAHAGLRPCEIAHLHREHVTEKTITVVEGKGRKSRVVPTHPAVWRLVEPLPAGPVTRRRDGSPAEPHWVSHRTNAALRRQEIAMTLYNLRHYFATTVEERYGDPRVTQELMGHASLNTTMIYTHVAEKRKRAAVETLPDLTV